MTVPVVDVVILTWNDGPRLERAVESALGSTGVDVRVVVVDNGSDEPVTVPAGVALVRNDENRGVAAARNQGARLGSAPYLLLLDSDAELRPDCLARLVAELGDDGVAMAAPVFVDQRPTDSAGAAPTFRVKAERALNRRDGYEPTGDTTAPSWDVDFAIGACQLVRRSAWDAVGGLDETYFYGPEDVDFCLRLGAAGHRIRQVAAAACLHPPRRRHRNLMTVRGAQHGVNVVRHLWRHRRAA
ncbi:MAG: glycosyltransferase family 2 protein [Acidimicrobiales bacterium]